MPLIETRREYADGDLLLDSDFNAFLDDIETFLNVTKIDNDNIQDVGISASFKLANATVTTAKLTDSVVSVTKLEDAAAITSCLDNANVTNAKLASSAITTPKIVNDSVTLVKIEDGTETSMKRLTKQVFSTSGVFTPPAGCTTIWIEAVGGGGGGGSSYYQSSIQLVYAGSRGGVGSYTFSQRNVTPGSPVTITVGAGGTGGPAPSVSDSGFNGGAGSDTLVGGVVVGKGGNGGVRGGLPPAVGSTNTTYFVTSDSTNAPTSGTPISGLSNLVISPLPNNGPGGGGGGSGGSSLGSPSATFRAAGGGNGGRGLVIIWY